MDYLKEIDQIFDELVEFRRDLHMHPELGYEEFRTQGKIFDALKDTGLEVSKDYGNTGVLATLYGQAGPGETILIRADIDALPIQEENDLAYCSQEPGKMHACGHDIHTSIVLGLAKILAKHKDQIKGNIKFVFQPAEEIAPTGGAQMMIDDGVMENPKVDRAYALHVWNNPLGTVAIRDGAMMAQSDRLSITIKGKSSHAAQPQRGNDAIVAAAMVINALQTVISRNTDPLESAVLTLGTINGGKKYNVICDQVQIEGTVRLLSDEVIKNTKPLIERVATNVAAGFGCQAIVNYTDGYAMTKNDHELFLMGKDRLEEEFGPENVLVPKNPNTGGEDFSAYGKHVPILFMWLGMESEMNKGKTTIHNKNLLINEDIIKNGIRAFIALLKDTNL
ncbi:MAG: amidohydrolase [Bacillota bacterium]|nr:amidohydrolase [Bacillota bacterium]